MPTIPRACQHREYGCGIAPDTDRSGYCEADGSLYPSAQARDCSRTQAPIVESSPAPEIFFAQTPSTGRLPPFWGENRFWTRFCERGHEAIFRTQKPPYRGVHLPHACFFHEGGSARARSPLLIAGSLLAPLRCAAPCQSRGRATLPPSRYPHLSQAAFAPSVRSRCLSSAGRASRPGRRRA